MNPTPENQEPVQDSLTVDGSALTPEEQAMIAKGLDETRDEAAETEAKRLADEQAAQEEQQRQEAEQAAQADADRKAQEAVATAAAAPAAPLIPEAQAKPEAPKDFDAEFAALDTKIADAQALFDKGEMDADEYGKLVRESNVAIRQLHQAESRYTSQLAAWELSESSRNQAIEAAQTNAQSAWNAAALDWEQKNADFLANPLRAKAMQDCIAMVDATARAEGRALSAAELLAEAGKQAMEAYGYKPPAAPNGQEEVRKAVAERTSAKPGATLGDVPTGGTEPVRGNESYAALDNLGIEELETATAHMSAGEVEKFLRDAPGANAHGRD